MGVHKNIDYDKFPKQGKWLNLRVRVLFHFGEKELMGKIIRDDMEEPGETIILLDDGRVVRTTECQYAPELPPGQNRSEKK